LIVVIPADQHLHERKQEFEILRGWLKAKRINAVFAGFGADFEIRAAQQAGKLFVASAQVKDERPGTVFLKRQGQKIIKERLAAAGAAGHKRMGYIVAGIAGSVLDALMEIQIERSSIDGFDNGQGLAVEKRVPAMALV